MISNLLSGVEWECFSRDTVLDKIFEVGKLHPKSNSDFFLVTSWDTKKLKSKCLAGNRMGMFTEGAKCKAVHLSPFHGESNGDIFRGGTWMRQG